MVAFLSVPISFNNDWFTGLSGWNRNHGFYHDSLGFLNPTLLDWRREVIDCDIDQPCKVHNYFSNNDYYKSLLIALFGPPFQHYSSDYFSNAFSIHENFFFSIHALYDFMHLQWQSNKIEDGIKTASVDDINKIMNTLYQFDDDDLGKYVSSCSGVRLNDTLTREMCFTWEDIGLSSTGISNTEIKAMSGEYTRNPKLPCMLHRHLIELFSDYSVTSNDPSIVLIPREDLYTYDRIAEDYSWHHIEPAEECPMYSDFCEQTSTKSPIELKFIQVEQVEYVGEVVCINNRKSFEIRRIYVEPDESKCVDATNIPKPAAVIKKCRCEDEYLKWKTNEHRNKIQREKLVKPLLYTSICLVGFIVLTCLQSTEVLKFFKGIKERISRFIKDSVIMPKYALLEAKPAEQSPLEKSSTGIPATEQTGLTLT